MPLPNMLKQKSKEKCSIERLVIAYFCPMNIGNLLSHHNLDTNSMAPPDKAFALSNTNTVSQDPARCSVARFVLCVCVFSVCVCV